MNSLWPFITGSSWVIYTLCLSIATPGVIDTRPRPFHSPSSVLHPKKNFPWPHLAKCLAFVLPADCGANMGVWKIRKLVINHGTLGTCSTLWCSIFKQPRIRIKNWCEARGQKKPRIKTAHRFNTWGLSSNNQNVANEHQTIRKGTGSIQQLRFDSHKKHRFKTFRINQTGTWTFLKLLWDPKITVF